MAASDKARFFLEQYVPELQEYERKGIFSSKEITSISSKRSDFEHTLNARGSKPSDYARYATYEINLDSLRKRRSKRLGVKSTAFSGQRTIFFILDRATKKFPGDMGLWMQYIDYCQREKANKKLTKVFTNVLRLKPRDWSLWVLAAKHFAEHRGDMSTARSYMQRGLRFCNDERKLWLEYARLEMVYLAKLAARRKVLGLDEQKRDPGAKESEDEDMLMLPSVTAEEISLDANRSVEEVDEKALEKLASAPVLTGAIPMAIFDAATKQFKDSVEVGADFFDVVESFGQVPSARKILKHILGHMQATEPNAAEAIICEARLELFDTEAHSAEFPAALGRSLVVIKKGHESLSVKAETKMAERAVLMLLPFLKARKELDEDVARVLQASTRRHLRIMEQTESRRTGSVKQNSMAALVERLLQQGQIWAADVLQEYREAMDLG